MATVSKRIVTFEDGACFWDYEYNNVTLKLTRFKCTNNSPYGTRGTITSTAPERADNQAYALGDLVRPIGGNGHIYKTSVAGTTAGTPPTFPTGNGQTVTDGTVTWQEIGPDTVTRTVLAGGSLNQAIPSAVADTFKLGVDARGRLTGIDHNFEMLGAA